MQLVSGLGLVALLGIAWAISYHRREVKLRPIIWGIGLQLLFALIILRQDLWSFVGMATLAVMIVAYIFRTERERRGPVVWIGSVIVGSLGLGAGLSFVPATGLGWTALAIVVALIANGRFKLIKGGQRVLGALFIVVGTSYLIVAGLYGERIFSAFSDRVAGFLSLSDFGAQFLFGNLANSEHFFTSEGSSWPGFGFQFGFKVLPTIIFFGGFMGVLYYLGVMQKVIATFSRFMRWTIGTSGAETLSCSANIFVGQTEAPLLIKPFLGTMTRSELTTIMVGGFATIAGGVLAGYIAMGVPAGHLVAASVMSAPAALVIGKIICPELEQSKTAGDVTLPDIDSGANAIEAATKGISDGLKLAVNVGAMLIGFIALIAVIDVLLNWFDSLIDGDFLGGEYVRYATGGGLSPALGEHTGIFPGSLRTLFGVLLRPVAFLMGVPWADADEVGNLLGIKLSLNEFVAYGTLGTYIQSGALSERAAVVSTYALCGFANFSSIGIQIGGISAIAPERRSDLAKVGVRAMIGGALASFTTATIAGLLLT